MGRPLRSTQCARHVEGVVAEEAARVVRPRERERAARERGGEGVERKRRPVADRARRQDRRAAAPLAVFVRRRRVVEVQRHAFEPDRLALVAAEQQERVRPHGLERRDELRLRAPVGDGEHDRRERGLAGERMHHPLGGILRVPAEGREAGN